MLILPNERAFGMRLMAGVGAYSGERGGWWFTVPGLGGQAPETADPIAWAGDGVILPVTSQPLADALLASRRPFVNITAFPGVPSVGNDNHAIGLMAAEHLLERGFRNFAFAEYDTTIYASQRGEAFRDAIRQARFECIERHRHIPSGGTPEPMDAYAQWLQRLPRPCGVFVFTDARAWAILQAAERLAIRVPDELAILGADNEPFCACTNPPLSSIALDGYQIGYRAAQLLDELMHGAPAPAEPILIPPRHIVVRRSTDALAIADPLVADVIRHIRLNAHRPIDVAELLRDSGVSRRTLERRFLATRGHTPFIEIRNAQLRHAERLLRETDLSISRVARSTAFATLRQLGKIFREEHGISPSAWRKRFRSS